MVFLQTVLISVDFLLPCTLARILLRHEESTVRFIIKTSYCKLENTKFDRNIDPNIKCQSNHEQKRSNNLLQEMLISSNNVLSSLGIILLILLYILCSYLLEL